MTRSAPRETRADAAVTIEVDDLVAGFDDKLVLEGISFTLRERESLVVLGPSGCGKSTLLRTLVGLHPPLRGSIRLLGRDLSQVSRKERVLLFREVGVAFQGSALLGSLTIGENVALPLREHTDLDPVTIRIMTRLKLDLVGLGDSEDLMPAQLSGGMRKRAGIARALAMDPQCLFLDEPSAGLDPITAAGVDELLAGLRRALGLTLVVVTHDIESARLLADRMLLLDRGRVRAHGSAEEMDASQDDFVRRFFDRRAEKPGAAASQLVDELTR